jgi:hypothetical protein
VRSALLALLLLSGLLPGVACAHRPLAVVLSFAACPAGAGGVAVAANVASDLAPAAREVARDQFPGACALDPGPGGLPALACGDPRAGRRYALVWTRPSPRTLVLERREYAVAPGAGATAAAPALRRPVAELAIERKTWISAPPRPTCGGAP